MAEDKSCLCDPGRRTKGETCLEHILGPAVRWRRHIGGLNEIAVLAAWYSASNAVFRAARYSEVVDMGQR
jgi:hypothetical protein